MCELGCCISTPPPSTHNPTTAPNDSSEASYNRISCALAQRRQQGTPFAVLALEFGLPPPSATEPMAGRPAAKPTKPTRQSLPRQRRCYNTGDAQGSPPRLDLFKAAAAVLARNYAEQGGDPALGKLGPTWLRRFLSLHPELSTKLAINLDRQRALASNPGPIKTFERLHADLMNK